MIKCVNSFKSRKQLEDLQRMYADVVFCWFRMHASRAFSDIGSDSTRTTHIITFIFISTVHHFLACFVFLSVLPPPSSFWCFSSCIPTSNSMVVFRWSPCFDSASPSRQKFLWGSHESLQGMEECFRRAGLVRCTSHRRTRHGHSTGWSWSLEGLARNSRSNWNMSNHVTSIHPQQKDVHWQWVAWVAMETADSVPSGMRNYLRLPEMTWLKAHEAFTMNNLIFAESHRWETLKCITLLATQLATSSTCIAGYLLFSLGTDVTFIHFYCDFVFAR